jgi:DNA-binding NarL/FixJ family response regulator
MSEVDTDLAAARAAYARRRWPEARRLFHAARERAPLPADDLTALADADWWLGLVDESVAVGDQAYHAHLGANRPRSAAMAAIGVAVNHFLRGDAALGAGWMGRAGHALDAQPDAPEHGYLIFLIEVEGGLDGPDPELVVAAARRVAALGRQHHDPNLVAMGRSGEGRARLRQGRVPEGLALLDEAMVAALGDELLPEYAGNVYCHLMAACWELADIRRARTWVDSTSGWLRTLPAAVLFHGICRIHRAQVLQITGDWSAAAQEAALVCAELAGIAVSTAAEGHYQLAELHRLGGRFDAAEREYRQAHRLGRDPQPGLALLRMAQDRVDAAAGAVRTALLATPDNRLQRARLCAAAVEIALAGADPATAEHCADELAEIAAAYRSPGFTAAAEHCRGAVLLSADHPEAALPVLRSACRRWQELSAPYECARVRVLLAGAYQALGDADGAELELSAAAEVFEMLGAQPDVDAVAALRGAPGLPGELTEREAQVLACLARGRSNKEIGAALVISEKTVARHLSNIFTKLGVTSRTAAAAYAFEHGLAG